MSVTPIPDGTPDWGPILNAQLNDLQQQVTSNFSTQSTSGWTPEDQGLIAWTVDPATVASTLAVPTGSLQMGMVSIKKAVTAVNITIGVQTAQVTGTAGQNFAAIYNSAGTLLGQTADQTTAWSTTGNKVMTLNAITPLQPGKYWLALLVNGGGAGPVILRGGSVTNTVLINIGTPTNARRFAVFGSGLTALPPTFDPTLITSGVNSWNMLLA